MDFHNSFEAYICYCFTNLLIDLFNHSNPYLVAGYTPIVIPFSVQTNMKTILQSVAKLMRAENVSLPNLDDGYRENKRKFWTEFLVSETLHSYDEHDETTGIMRLPTGLGLMVAACVGIDLLRQVDSAP